MSATAFIVQDDLAVLVSDGYIYQNGKIIDQSSRKVWKLSATTGLVWMGTQFESVDRIITSVTGKDGKAAIDTVAVQIEKDIKDNPQWLDRVDREPFNIFTFEWKGGECHRWRLFYPEDQFIPFHKGIVPSGSQGVLIPEADVKEASRLFQQLIPRKWKMYRPSLERTAKESFQRMVEFYHAEGVPVGGEIFTETIQKTQL